MIHLNAPNTPAAPDPRFFLELLIPSSKCSKLIFFLDLEICQIEIHHLIQQKRRIISVQRTVPRAHGAGDQSRPCRIASRTRRHWPTLVTWMGCGSAARRRAPSPGRRGWTMPPAGSKVRSRLLAMSPEKLTPKETFVGGPSLSLEVLQPCPE